MTKGRVEALSDGVIAIIITIMVLELKEPHGTDLAALKPLLPTLLSYVLSFIYLGIYWNNHHHMFQATKHVSGGILWANLHLLFWLSLVPFVTNWVGENPHATIPTAVYGFMLLMTALAYTILQRMLIRVQGDDKTLQKAFSNDAKGIASPIIYVFGILGSLWMAWVGQLAYVIVALIWLVPDRRIERELIVSEE